MNAPFKKYIERRILMRDHPVIESIERTGYPKMEHQVNHWGTDIQDNEILVGDSIVRLPNGEVLLEDNLEDYLIEVLGFEFTKAK
jgi:hypothetical protein